MVLSANLEGISYITSRGFVDYDDKQMFNFIYIVGDQAKEVMIKAISHSVNDPFAIDDVQFELFDTDFKLIKSVGSWCNQDQAIIDRMNEVQFTPQDCREAATVVTLSPNQAYYLYTGPETGTAGNALVDVNVVGNVGEVVASSSVDSFNGISYVTSRGFVDYDDKQMFNFIYVVGDQDKEVMIKAISHSVNDPFAIDDVQFELFDTHFKLIKSVGSWCNQDQAIIDRMNEKQFTPTDCREAATVVTLSANQAYYLYTGPETGVAGNALVDVFMVGNANATANTTTTEISTVSVATGQSLYNDNCAVCHGNNPANGKDNVNTGTSVGVIRAAINNNKGGMGIFRSMSDDDLANIAAYISSTL